MISQIEIRETTSADRPQILALYPQVFPDEDLKPLISALLEQGSKVLSLAAFEGEELVAHIIFTLCGTEINDQSGALLGPLGVIPRLQRQGMGGFLTREGLERLEKSGIIQVFVLGDPAYYKRYGFAQERQVLPPYTIPEKWAEAWQSMPLASRPALAEGHLTLPTPWMDPSLWG